MISIEEQLGIQKDTPLQSVDLQKFYISGVNLFIKREDLIHPAISGNKWYKLKYNLLEAKKNNFDTLLTFGGAYSNHIYALASAGKELGFNTIGIIRGEEHQPINQTLSFAKNCGMKIYYLNRTEYRMKDNPDFLDQLKIKFGNFYLIPEGGTNQFAVKGCEEILKNINIEYDSVIVPVGTGGTLAGIINGIRYQRNKKAIGISVLKNAAFLKNKVSELINSFSKNQSSSNWEIILDYHFGGYAKFNKVLLEFINEFKEKTEIQLDPIYTGKMMFGIFDLINKEYFKKDSTIVAIHTGGLQGISGLKERFGEKLLNF